MAYIKEEFAWRKLFLCYKTPEPLQFTTSQWTESRLFFLAYRVLIFLYWVIAPILSWEDYNINDRDINTNTDKTGPAARNPNKWWSNLTAWGFIVLEVDFLLAALICCMTPCVERYGNRYHPSVQRQWNFLRVLSWLVTIINSSIGVFITFIYFGHLYNYAVKTPISAFDLHLHGLNTVFIVVDNVVSARPYLLLHFIYPLIFAGVYYIFTAIFWSFDHLNNRNFTDILDWNRPGTTIGYGVGFGLLLIFIHTGHFFLYRLKVFVHSKLCKPNQAGFVSEEFFELDPI